MDSLKVITLNVRGLNDQLKCRKLMQWLKDSNYDIMCLQETYLTECKEKMINDVWSAEYSINNFTDSPHSRGVSILFNPRCDVQIIDTYKCDNARVIITNVKISGNIICIVNVYAPNKPNSRKDFFHKLHKLIGMRTLNDSCTVMAGDFNCCLNVRDRISPSVQNDCSRGALLDILHKYDLHDCYAIKDRGVSYTWEASDGSTKSRLDYMFISGKLKNSLGGLASRYFIGSKHGERISDHKFVSAVLENIVTTRGPGYWKMNTEYLHDDRYKARIQEIIKNIKQKKGTYTPSLLWELVKIEIKSFSASYAVVKAKDRRKKEKEIEAELTKLEGRYDDQTKNKREALQSELNEIYSEKVKGQQIRAKAEWREKGERSNKYFFRLEKSRQSHNAISSLKLNGHVVTENSKLHDIIAEYYENLYKSDAVSQVEIDAYLQDLVLPHLSEAQQNMCDKKIDRKELREVVKHLKDEKSPGSDGIPSEFYKYFWCDLEDLYIDMLTDVNDNLELPCSLRRAIIALIFKKGDSDDLENYRPISLTNIDYKILAGVLANRIKAVLPKIISTDQTGYMKGRFIGTNTRLIQDIISYSEKEGLEGALLMLDFRKAFDSIEHIFLFSALKRFGFGQNLIKWITILYNGAFLNVKNNGWIGKKVNMNRGIRQGCPVSGLLFIIAVEIMAAKIRQNNNIKGFRFGPDSKEHKISQYVDDSTISISSMHSIYHVLDTVEMFGRVAGPKLNLNKTEGIWLGPYKHVHSIFAGISFKEEPIRCLGIYVGHSKEACCERNWMAKVKKIQASLQVWKTRNLSLIGKVLLLKTLGLSQIAYLASVVVCPDNIIKDIERLFYNFIWNGKDRIKRMTLIADYECGGIKMPDIRSYIEALQAVWVPKIMKSKNETWAMLVKHVMERELGCGFEDIIRTSVTSTKDCPILMALPEYIRYIILSFNKCKASVGWQRKKYLNSVMSSLVWGNENIKDKNKTLWYKEWIKAGFRYVKDFYDENGNFIKPENVYQRLSDKRNWICEYLILKKIINSTCKGMDTKGANYINIKPLDYLFHRNKAYKICNLISRTVYWFLISDKCVANYMEKVWKNRFQCDPMSRALWNNIYNRKCFQMVERKIGMFNYKLLTNALPSPIRLSKWISNIAHNCEKCQIPDNIEHFLFDCSEIKTLWKHVGESANIMISYKHIIMGHAYFSERQTVYENIDNMISYVAYFVYSFKMKCKNGEHIYNEKNAILYVQKQLCDLLKKLNIFEQPLGEMIKKCIAHLRR